MAEEKKERWIQTVQREHEEMTDQIERTEQKINEFMSMLFSERFFHNQNIDVKEVAQFLQNLKTTLNGGKKN